MSPQRSGEVMALPNRGDRSSMDTIKRGYQVFLSLVVFSNIWVSGAISSLVPFVQLSLDLPLDWHPTVFIFAAALIPYNLDRVIDSFVQKIPDRQAQAYFRQAGPPLIVIVASLTLGHLIYQANADVRWASLVGLLPLIYGVPLVPLPQHSSPDSPQTLSWRWYRLKDIPGAKAWIVSSTITYAVVALPITYAQAPFDRSAGLLTLFLLIFISTNSHLFDIRDVESDREKGVATVPLLIGVTATRIVWSGLNLILVAVMLWAWLSKLSPVSPAVFLPIAAIDLIALGQFTPNTPRTAYDVLLDGSLVLPLVFTGLWYPNA